MTNTPGKAHLSIGVRKLERQIVNANSPVGPIDTRNEVQRDEPPSMDYLPELRGNLITGTVLLKENNTPAVGRIIYLSVPTKEYLFYTSVTDSTGRFYFNSDELISSQYIVLKMEGCNDNCAMSLDDDFIKDHAEFVPSRLKIEPGLTLLIENQSVRSQIENAYYPLNRDSIAKGKNNRFYRNPDHVYYLDKYVRFPTMEDVLREYVAEVYVRKRDGTFTIKAMNGRTGVAFRENPLLLLDGVPVFDPNIIMNYDPMKVEKIDIVTHGYFYGPLRASGVISFQTYEGDAQDLSFQDAVKQLYLGVQPYKIYYSPNYSVAREALARIPDYRIQLFWNPDIVIESNMTASIDFYTSDIAGEFEITIEGFLGNGEFVHQEEIIQVNNR